MFTEQTDQWLVVGYPATPSIKARVDLRNLSTGELYHMDRAESRVLGELLRKVEQRFATAREAR